MDPADPPFDEDWNEDDQGFFTARMS